MTAYTDEQRRAILDGLEGEGYVSAVYVGEVYRCGGETCVNLGHRYRDCGHWVDETVAYDLHSLRRIVAQMEQYEIDNVQAPL